MVIYTIATMKRYGYSQQNDFNVIYAKIVVGQIVGKIQIIQKIYEKIQLNKRIYLCNKLTQHHSKGVDAMKNIKYNEKEKTIKHDNEYYKYLHNRRP